MTAPDAIRLERIVAGPIERVWSYLTEGDKRGTWLASGEMELLVGGRVEHVFRTSDLTRPETPRAKYWTRTGETRMRGFMVGCDPPRLLAYTWAGMATRDSEVSFELSSLGESVLLVLTHRRLATRDDMVGVAGGWHTHLDMLCDRLAGRTPPPFCATYRRLEAEYEQRIPIPGP
jgi:uncharacterized protein YndB with AHSA1/START domain